MNHAIKSARGRRNNTELWLRSGGGSIRCDRAETRKPLETAFDLAREYHDV